MAFVGEVDLGKVAQVAFDVLLVLLHKDGEIGEGRSIEGPLLAFGAPTAQSIFDDPLLLRREDADAGERGRDVRRRENRLACDVDDASYVSPHRRRRPPIFPREEGVQSVGKPALVHFGELDLQGLSELSRGRREL